MLEKILVDLKVISRLTENDKLCTVNADNITIELSDVEITSTDIPGVSVATNDGVTVALDITITEQLKEES